MFLHETCSGVLVCCISDMQWSGGMFLHETRSGLVECSSNRHVVECWYVPVSDMQWNGGMSCMRHAVDWWNVSVTDM